MTESDKRAEYVEELFRKGNFFFIYNSHPELYRHALNAERYFYLDKYQSAISLRAALATYTATLARKNHIHLGQTPSLGQRLTALVERGLFPQNKNELRLTLKDGSEQLLTRDALLQKLCNEGAHREREKRHRLLTADNLFIALREFHAALCHSYYHHYEPQAQTFPGFNKGYMPIGDYFIRLPIAARRVFSSVKAKRYVAERAVTGMPRHAVIYHYDPARISRAYLERRGLVSDVARRHKLYAAIPPLEIICDNQDAVLIAYTFEARPHSITADYLTPLSFSAKLALLLPVAQTLAALHQAQPAVFHRALNLQALVLEGDELKLTGFNFAKVDDAENPRGTLREEFLQAKLISHCQGPECLPQADEDEAAYQQRLAHLDWGKYDVFGLGTLLCTLLENLSPGELEGGQHVQALRQAYGDSADDDFWALLEQTLAADPARRPTMATVAEQLVRCLDAQNHEREES